MPQNIWKAKYTKRYYLRPKSVGHFCTQPEGLCRTRKGPGTTAQQVPCFGDTPLHRWPRRATPEGPSVTVPVLGLLALLHPDLSVSLCQHGILQQQGINPVSSGAQPQLPSAAAAALGFIASRALGPQPHLTSSASRVKEDQNIAMVHPLWSYKARLFEAGSAEFLWQLPVSIAVWPRGTALPLPTPQPAALTTQNSQGSTGL